MMTYDEFKEDVEKGVELLGDVIYVSKPYLIQTEEGEALMGGTLEKILNNEFANMYFGRHIIIVRDRDFPNENNEKVKK